MSRANPFGDLTDFAPQDAAKPVPAEAIEQIAAASGFPSRKAVGSAAPSPAPVAPARTPRRHTTGRNRQINIKATEETVAELYRVADALGLPLGAVLEQAIAALAAQKDI
ncbi:hypothetical protein [Sphingobium sp. TCM1]|uniref:hypothetical protein n=1 Tax=Sphingobium sp. TCM1 TaxID=453246 RepID=UPI0007F5358C|nr:hypothetical protein [Sphingobium sp. TCM1]OAN54308.1 hypothetical protein A7Q26_24030 [Sphingobium sp. TCM1]